MRLSDTQKIIFGILTLFFLTLPTFASEVQFTTSTDIQLLTKDTSTLSTVRLQSDSVLSNIVIETDHIDVTLENQSTPVIFTTENAYFLPTIQSGTGGKIDPACPLQSISITSSSNVVIRLEITSSQPACASNNSADDDTVDNVTNVIHTPVESDSGNGGGSHSNTNLIPESPVSSHSSAPSAPNLSPDLLQNLLPDQSSDEIKTSAASDNNPIAGQEAPTPIFRQVPKEDQIIPFSASVDATENLPDQTSQKPSSKEQNSYASGIAAELFSQKNIHFTPYFTLIIMIGLAGGIFFLTENKHVRRQKFLKKRLRMNTRATKPSRRIQVNHRAKKNHPTSQKDR